MAKGYLPLPDGSYVTVRDDETPEQAFARARKEYPEAFEVKRVPAEPEEGVIAAGIGSTKRTISTARTGLESLFSPEEAARKGVERAEELGQQYAPGTSLEAVKQAYADRGLMGGAGEVISQIPTALAEQFPQIAATLGGARAGAMAGQRIAGPRGALIGGIGGAVVPSALQLFGANIERQAAEQMEEGKPLDISRTRAAVATAPGALLEVAATFIPLGRTLIGKVLGPGAAQALARGSSEATENLAKEGLAKVLTKGTATGALLEIPTEVIQQMLERAQAGLPLTSEDAYAEYGEAAYGAGLVGGPFGAVGRVGQRSVARGEVAEREAAATAEEQRLAAEAAQAEEERAAAEAEAEEARKATPEYRQELNSQIVEAKDRLREIETVLKDKTLDEDVKKEAIEEAKTLRKTIGDLSKEMRESIKAAGQAPTLEQALAKQKETAEAEPGVVYDEYGLPVKTKTKPLTEAEEAAGYELQAARVNAEFEKRERDFQAVQEKNQQEELRRDKQLQEQLSGFIEGYDELQRQPYGPTEFVKSEREKQQAQEITLDRMQLALDKFTPRLLGLKPDDTVAKLQAEYDRLSAPEAIAKVKSSARPNYMNMLGRLEDRLRTSFEKAAPNSRQGYDNALANGFVNRFVTSTLGIKGLGGRTLSFNDALPQVEARIAELEEQRQKAITSKDPLMSDKGQLTPAGEKLVVNEAKLTELKRIVEGARAQMPEETGAESAVEGTLQATTAIQTESPAVQVEQGLPRAAYEAKIEEANKKATGSFDALLSFVDDLQKKRFFGGAPGQLGLASSTEERLQEQVKQAKGRVIDGLLEEVATTRVANKMRPLSTAEAYMFVEDVAGLVDMLVERSLAAAPGMQTETVTTPGQMRGTKLVEGATETEVDRRTERQLPFGATPRSQDIIAGMSEKDQQEFSESFDRLRKNVRDAKARVTQIDDTLNVMQPPKPVAKKGEAALAPVQRRATFPESPEAQKLADERVNAVDALRKAEQELANARAQIKASVKGVSEKQAVQTIRNVIRSIKESTIAEGKRPVLASYATDLIGSRPRDTKKSDAQLDVEDRIIEDVGQILPTLDPDSEAFRTLDEAATTLANEDVSRDFVDLVGEQVQRIRQGTDEATDPQLLSDIRSALDAQRAGREFAQADDTMMVTQGKRFKEVETQPDLFPETRATTRATPGQFQRLQKSKEVQGKRKEIAAERIAKEKAEAELKQLERDLRAAKRNADVEATAALEKEEKNIFEEITKLAENIKRGMGDNISTTNAQKFAALDERIKKLVAEYRKKKPAVATSEVAENERILNKILKEADTPEPYNATQSNFTEAIAKTREAIERFEAKIKEANSALMEVANNPEVYEAKFKGLARYKKRGAAKARVEKLIEARTLFLEDAKKQLENFKLIARKTSVQPKVTVEKDKEESKIPDKELKAVRQALTTRINATLRRLKEQDTKLTEDVRGFIGLGLNLPGTRYERKSREELAKRAW
jgi:protein-tyrosine-phosphatase